MPIVPTLRRYLALACAAAVALVVALAARVPTQTGFASQIAALSEPAGYFDTDNLISNEGSYLHVLPELQRANVHGGAYIGVGPDQNFSYISQVRPALAFIIDVRRDNLLLHLLFKALFDRSRTRVEYLALLFARPVPDNVESWRGKSVEELVAYIDGAPRLDSPAIAAARSQLTERIRRFGVPLVEPDLQTIDRFHRRFIEDGLGLRFQSTGRPPQSNYPSYRQLLLETDRLGHHGNYLASEDAFQFVKSLQSHDLVIPVVGNLNGPSALVGIGRLLGERNERLSAFYTSNVEFYLFGDGTFPRFVENLSRMPRTDAAVIIRSVFAGGGPRVAGYGSASMTQPVSELVDGFSRGRFHQYWELTAAR
jgi:hypothetical protein